MVLRRLPGLRQRLRRLTKYIPQRLAVPELHKHRSEAIHIMAEVEAHHARIKPSLPLGVVVPPPRGIHLGASVRSCDLRPRGLEPNEERRADVGGGLGVCGRGDVHKYGVAANGLVHPPGGVHLEHGGADLEREAEAVFERDAGLSLEGVGERGEGRGAWWRGEGGNRDEAAGEVVHDERAVVIVVLSDSAAGKEVHGGEELGVEYGCETCDAVLLLLLVAVPFNVERLDVNGIGPQPREHPAVIGCRKSERREEDGRWEIISRREGVNTGAKRPGGGQ